MKHEECYLEGLILPSFLQHYPAEGHQKPVRVLMYSSMARCYLISSLEEAEAYLEHPILGRRLRECCRLVNLIESAQSRRSLNIRIT